MLVQKQHVGAYGAMVHAQSLLLVKKSRGPYTGRWDLPGGGLRHGEGISKALIREIMEELQCSVNEREISLWTNLSALVVNDEMSFYHIGLIYRVYNFDPLKVNLDNGNEDVAGAKWHPFHLSSEEQFTPFAFYIINILNQSRENV